MKTNEKSTPLGMSIAPNFSSFEIKTVLPLNTGIASYSQYVLNQNDNRRFFITSASKKSGSSPVYRIWVFL
jgi:hypothetical protein